MKNNFKIIIKHLIILLTISFFIVVAGFLYANSSSLEEEKNIRKDLSSRLETIANSLDAHRFEELTYTPEDNNLLSYQILRKELIENAEINEEFGVRWIYTMIPKDNQIVFAVDSITDSNHSEPGDIYTDAGPEFENAFNKAWLKGELSIIGPYSDQWGEFLSIIAPVRDLETNQILNVIGIDVDYQNFYIQKIKDARTEAYVFTTLFLIGFILSYVFVVYLMIQRKRLHIEKLRLDYALEAAGDGLWDWNIKNNDVFLSHRFKQMLGYADNEFKNDFIEWRNKIHPEDFPLVSKLLKDHLYGVIPYYENTHRILCKDGTYKWILSRGKVVSFDSYDNPDRMVGTHTDVDTLKKIELELAQKVLDNGKIRTATLNILEDIAEEKDKFQKISNRLNIATKSGNIGILELDLKNNNITGNDIVDLIYGLPISESGNISLKEWMNRVHPEDRINVKRAIDISIKKGINFSMVFRIITKQNKIRYIRGFAALENDTEGNPVRLVGVNIDITKDYEVDKAKSEFVSLASHQLKTPVGAMSWNLEMLLGGDYGKISKTQREVIQELYDMNRRMADLVNSFLNLSRIELGTFVIQPEPVVYTKICENVLKELEPRIKEKEHTIEKHYQENIPETQADPKLLHIIFQNLISNAVKYTQDKGKIDISIGVEQNDILIKVNNNGRVIPLEDRPRIFDRLFRASNAQVMDPNGNGLGLYLLKAIVEKSGGNTWFESVENLGTTFYVKLPINILPVDKKQK